MDATTTLQPVSANVIAVLAAAESLTPVERRAVIECLALGLEDGSDDQNVAKPVLSDAWWRVLAQRSADYAAGRAETVSWEEIQTRWANGG